ncbi:gamma-crystallin N-like [Polypterus senegalus]|uniref:gamma-crystallin N-like n=1 Tax=Polypterus senegalus TaxID=55291 RepID=UPI00196275B2|nr:gamma-crystallin N-like [Polypterus senegalus]
MNDIILYKGEHFTGENVTFNANISDLHVYGFGRLMASLKVEGHSWVTFSGPQFEGDATIYRNGNYPSIPDEKRFASMKIMKNMGAPHITLFAKINFDGPSTDLDEHTPLPSGYKVASYRVRSGAWCLHEFQDETGKKHVAFKGDEVANCQSIGFENHPASLKPA